MFNRVCLAVNVCVSDDADPAPRRRGFAKATKTSGAAKVYWRRLNSKRRLSVLEWTSESEYFQEILLQT